MNRYATSGLIRDAASGKRVLVLSRTATVASEAALAVATHLDASDVTIRRANGEQRIEYPNGGRITFRSARADIRGVEADVVFMDEGVDRIVSYVEISHAIAREGGELVRC